MLTINDSAFPAPVLVAFSTLVVGATFRLNGQYLAKMNASVAINYTLSENTPVPAVAMVESVAAELVITAPAAP